MTNRHFAALLGFAFVAAWIAWGFGSAVLCLVGAAAFVAVAAVLRGELDLAELQDRVRVGTRPAPDHSDAPGPPRPPGRSRVR